MTPRTVSGDLSLRPGRNEDDSSSSRESSPGPTFGGKRKRSFSPGSVDGSPEPAEPFVNDETPQPEDRPLIRQAVAFGGVTSSFSLPTSSIYTATLPAPTTGKAQFLPGQVVKKPRRKKKDDAPYKKHSGRFRLEAYNPGTPSEVLPGPMIQQGPGPYASAFRGYTDPRSTRSASPAVTPTSTLASHSERSASPAPTRGSANKRAATNGTTSKTTQARSCAQARTSSHIPTQAHSGASPPVMGLFNGTTQDMMASSPNSRGSHYRLDYETGRSLQPNSTSTSATMSMDTSLDFPMMPPAEPAQPMQGIVQAPASYITPPSPNLAPPSSPKRLQPRTAEVSSAPRHLAPSGRMVTILAQDIRSGEPDHLLVEVKVPIRPADNPADGYWADAKDLVEQWQGGPARIDGPARVYSLRGKYRQILLRVTSLNEDRYASSNVVINRERVIEVVIENLPEAGAPPPRPQIPLELRQDVEMTPMSTYVSVVPRPVANTSTSGRSTVQLGPAPVANGNGLNHHSTASPTNHRVPSLPRSSPQSPPREPTHQPPKSPTPGEHLPQPAASTSASTSSTLVTAPVAHNDTTATGPSLLDLHPQYRPENIAALRRTNKGYESPGPEDEPKRVDQAIIKLLSVLIPKEDRRKFTEFFSKASLETASNMVFRYRYVQELIDKYAGQPAPFKSTSDYIVEERHIIDALKIEDSDGRYASNCRETLHLLQLYGQDGERFEDSEVLKLMAETEVAYNAKPVKRLLRLLRDIDARYIEQRGTS